MSMLRGRNSKTVCSDSMRMAMHDTRTILMVPSRIFTSADVGGGGVRQHNAARNEYGKHQTGYLRCSSQVTRWLDTNIVN